MRWTTAPTADDNVKRKPTHFRFAWRPVFVYTDQSKKNTCWIWLERYCEAIRWDSHALRWEHDGLYVFEAWVEEIK